MTNRRCGSWLAGVIAILIACASIGSAAHMAPTPPERAHAGAHSGVICGAPGAAQSEAEAPQTHDYHCPFCHMLPAFARATWGPDFAQMPRTYPYPPHGAGCGAYHRRDPAVLARAPPFDRPDHVTKVV